MIHFVGGGPLDGKTDIREVDDHAYLLRENSEGWYTLHHDVADLKTSLRSDLVLSEDDLVAQWHQRNAPEDFQVGDVVVIQPAGVIGTIVAGPIDADGGRQWMVKVDGDAEPTVCGDADMLLYRQKG